jgi:hypothetical protein
MEGEIVEAESKLARLVNWVRRDMDRGGAFRKTPFYAFARTNDMERSALVFMSRCRQNGTLVDIGDGKVEVLVPKGRNLEEFYKNLLKIVDKPILETRPQHRSDSDLKRTVQPEESDKLVTKTTRRPEARPKANIEAKEESNRPKAQPKSVPKPNPVYGPKTEAVPPRRDHLEREKPPVKVEDPVETGRPDRSLINVQGIVRAISEGLEDKFKRIDDRIATVSSLIEYSISDLEKKVGPASMQVLENRIKQLEDQLDVFRQKAEAFDIIKGDAWQVVQALDIVEVERHDLKNALKKFQKS